MSKKYLRYPRYMFRKELALDFLRAFPTLNISVLEIGAGDRSLSFCLDNVNADIIEMSVMEHIEDDQKFLKKIHNLLNDNGMLLLSVPAKMRKWNISDKLAGHYRRYEKKELINLLNESSFDKVRFASYGFPIINMTSFIRDKLFKAKMNEEDLKTDHDFHSKESGTGLQKYFRYERFATAAMNLLFSEKIIKAYTVILKPFNEYDLGDGYLCLFRRRQ